MGFIRPLGVRLHKKGESFKFRIRLSWILQLILILFGILYAGQTAFIFCLSFTQLLHLRTYVIQSFFERQHARPLEVAIPDFSDKFNSSHGHSWPTILDNVFVSVLAPSPNLPSRIPSPGESAGHEDDPG